MASCALSVAVHALRLVDDDDRPRRLHELDGLAPGELVALLVDDVALLLCLGAGEVLAEGVDVDDEDLQRVAGGELAQPVHLLGVVDEVLEGQVVVERAEVLGGDLDVLEHAFADRDAGHDDDELLEAVAPRQLEDRAQVDVGLARAGLHLHREVRAAARLVGWAVEELPRLQRGCRVGHLDVVAGLDRAQCSPAACPPAAATGCRRPARSAPARRTSPSRPHVDDRVLRRALRLAVEEVRDGGHGVELEGLIGVELELHWALHRLETGHALGLEDLHGVGLELVVAGKAFIKAHDALRLLFGHGANQLQGQLPLKADQQRATCHAVYRLACKLEPLDRSRKWETALEQDFVKQIIHCATFADVLHMQFELFG